jgi:hypothetical protein
MSNNTPGNSNYVYYGDRQVTFANPTMRQLKEHIDAWKLANSGLDPLSQLKIKVVGQIAPSDDDPIMTAEETIDLLMIAGAVGRKGCELILKGSSGNRVGDFRDHSGR